MEYVAAANVEGKGNAIIKFTSSKEITLLNVLHVQKIRKNLVFGTMLRKKIFKLVFKFNKFVLTKGVMYVGKGYFSNGLFKINCTPKTINENNIIGSSYIVELYNLQPFRL